MKRVSCGIIAMLMLLSTTELAASPLGKLFSTPEQRAHLDRQRAESLLEQTAEEAVAPIEIISDMVVEEPLLIHMSGSMLRGDGSLVLWLNGVPVRQQDLPANVRVVERDALVQLQISTRRQTLLLKPGQTLDARAGELREAYQVNTSDSDAVLTAVLEQPHRQQHQSALAVIDTLRTLQDMSL